MNSKKLNNLQIIRAFAALNVVLFHSIGSSKDYGYPPELFGFLAGWGMNGVDVFFVLSGFIMVHSQWGEDITPKSFLLNRIYRIVPIYWIATFLIIALLIFLPSAFREATLDISKVLASLFFVSQPIFGEFPYVAVGWTLEFEALFYVLFACSLFFKNRIFSFFVLCVSIAAIVYIFNIKLIIFEFIWGVIAGLLYRNYSINRSFSFAMLLIGVVVFFSTIFLNYPLPRFVIWGVPAALIILGAAGIFQLSWRLGIFLGDASYSIYLIHLFFIPAFYKFVNALDIGFFTNDILVVLSFVGATLIGVIFYWVIERPLILKRRKWK